MLYKHNIFTSTTEENSKIFEFLKCTLTIKMHIINQDFQTTQYFSSSSHLFLKFIISIVNFTQLYVNAHSTLRIKGAATDMNYFARSKFSKSLVQKKIFSLI